MELPDLSGQPTKVATSQPANKPGTNLKYLLISFLVVLIIGVLAGGVWYMTQAGNTIPSDKIITHNSIITPTRAPLPTQKTPAGNLSGSSSSAAVTTPDSISLGDSDADLQDLAKDLQSL